MTISQLLWMFGAVFLCGFWTACRVDAYLKKREPQFSSCDVLTVERVGAGYEAYARVNYKRPLLYLLSRKTFSQVTRFGSLDGLMWYELDEKRRLNHFDVISRLLVEALETQKLLEQLGVPNSKDRDLEVAKEEK